MISASESQLVPKGRMICCTVVGHSQDGDLGD